MIPAHIFLYFSVDTETAQQASNICKFLLSRDLKVVVGVVALVFKRSCPSTI